MGNKAQPFLNPLDISKPHNLFLLPTPPLSLSLSYFDIYVWDALSGTYAHVAVRCSHHVRYLVSISEAVLVSAYILMDFRGFLTIVLTISLKVINSSNFVFFSCLLASFAHTLQAMLIHIKGWFLQFSSTML